MSNKQLLVTLPGRDDSQLNWEELKKLELEYGSEIVKDWLKGGQLLFPLEPTLVKSSEFLLHMERLRKRQEQRDYAKLMEGALPTGRNISENMSSYSPEHTGVGASGFQYAVVGLNMVIGVGCAFVASDFLAGQYGLSKTKRATVSLTAMIFVLFMEMILFIIRASKFDALDNARRKKLESTFDSTTGINYVSNEDKLVKKKN